MENGDRDVGDGFVGSNNENLDLSENEEFGSQAATQPMSQDDPSDDDEPSSSQDENEETVIIFLENTTRFPRSLRF